jgi:hypothetical protein
MMAYLLVPVMSLRGGLRLQTAGAGQEHGASLRLVRTLSNPKVSLRSRTLMVAHTIVLQAMSSSYHLDMRSPHGMCMTRPALGVQRSQQCHALLENGPITLTWSTTAAWNALTTRPKRATSF